MPRAKRYSEVRRMLLRKLRREDDEKLCALRDWIWDDLIVRKFKRGYSIEQVANHQPARNNVPEVEAAIRRVMRRQAQ